MTFVTVSFGVQCDSPGHITLFSFHTHHIVGKRANLPYTFAVFVAQYGQPDIHSLTQGNKRRREQIGTTQERETEVNPVIVVKHYVQRSSILVIAYLDIILSITCIYGNVVLQHREELLRRYAARIDVEQ